MKNITFTGKGWADFMDWAKTDRKIFAKISNLIEETSRTPFKGAGKPELLKHELNGHWFIRFLKLRLRSNHVNTIIRIGAC